jgi:hypothetical protein
VVDQIFRNFPRIHGAEFFRTPRRPVAKCGTASFTTAGEPNVAVNKRTSERLEAQRKIIAQSRDRLGMVVWEHLDIDTKSRKELWAVVDRWLRGREMALRVMESEGGAKRHPGPRLDGALRRLLRLR